MIHLATLSDKTLKKQNTFKSSREKDNQLFIGIKIDPLGSIFHGHSHILDQKTHFCCNI